MDLVVVVGGWEHECCGGAYERGQVVEFACLVVTRPDGAVELVETRHELGVTWPVERIRGRVVGLDVAGEDGAPRPVLRIPDGSALCGFGHDDGHLEDPWTGEVVADARHDFRVTVRVPGSRIPGAPSPYWS